MAKVCMIERDIKRKKTAKNKAAWLVSWKADVKAIRAREAKGEEVSFDEKMTLAFRRQKKPRNISPARIRNRCSQTGRPRSVYRKFMLCRNQLRELGSKGLIPGLRKSSW